jgi:hypothetical protein
MPKKIKFFPIEVLEYKNGIFSAGLLKNSPHKYDYYFLRIFDTYFHLRSDELFGIIRLLSSTLYCEDIYKRFKKSELKKGWFTLKQLNEEDKERDYYKNIKQKK